MPYKRMKVTVTGIATNVFDKYIPGDYYFAISDIFSGKQVEREALMQFFNEVHVHSIEDFDCVVSEAPYSDDPDAEEPHGSKTAAETLGGGYEEEPEPNFWYLNVYLTDQRYGGPEEGGWWYNAGYPATDLEDVAVCYGPYNKSDMGRLEIQRTHIQSLLDRYNSERRSDISSVLSEGRYIVCQEGHTPQHWPQEKPYYE